MVLIKINRWYFGYELLLKNETCMDESFTIR